MAFFKPVADAPYCLLKIENENGFQALAMPFIYKG